MKLFRKIGRKWRLWVPFLGLSLFLYVVSRVNLSQLKILIVGSDYRYFFFLPFVIVMVVLLQAFRWKIILLIQNINVNFLRLLKVQIIGNYYATITPSRLGYFLKIGYLKKDAPGSVSKITSSVIFDRVLDILVLLCFSVAGLSIVSRRHSGSFSLLLLFVAFLLVISLFVLFNKGRTNYLLSFFGIKKIVPKKLKELSRALFHDFYDNLSNDLLLLASIIISFVIWGLTYLQTYLIALSLGVRMGYFLFAFLFSISTVIALLPITISGLGTREATLILVLSFYGVSIEQIVAMSVIGLILCSYAPAFFGGLVSFERKPEQRDVEEGGSC